MFFPYSYAVPAPSDHVVSASQIDTYLQCARKWGWVYLEGFREPPNAAAALGSRVHAQLERFLKGGNLTFSLGDGSPDESGEIAQTAVPYLPASYQDVIVEGTFLVRSKHSGVWYTGAKDVEIAPYPGAGLIHDHKTTGNPRYAHTKESLPWNVQALLYSQDFMDRFGVDSAPLRWLYITTKGARRAFPVDVVLSRSHVESCMHVVDSVALEIVELKRRAPPVLELQPNANACEAYGGCPHRHRCNLSPVERLRSVMSNSVLASIKARKEALEAKAAQAPVAAAEEEIALDPVPINPPESALPPAPVDGDPYAGAPVAAAPQNSPDEVKPKKGRPKKVQEETQGALVAGVGAFALYVDCAPIRGRSVVPLAELVSKASEIIKESPECEGAEDYRFIPFGKGPGVLSLAVSRLAESCDAVSLSTRTPEGAVCLAALEAKAAYVVRGWA